MDTRLKKSNKFIGSIILILATLAGTCSGITGTVAVAIEEIKRDWYFVHRYGEDMQVYNSPFKAYNVDVGACTDTISFLVAAAIAFAVCFFGLWIVLCIMSGRYDLNEQGDYKLNWFDKVWTELQIILFGAASFGAFALAYPLVYSWSTLNIFDCYDVANSIDYNFGIRGDVIVSLSTIGMFICIGVAIIASLSIVKKLKAHKFWSASCLGSIFGGAVKAVTSRDDTLNKCILVFVVMLILAMTWVGAIIDIILFIYFAPKIVAKLNNIKKGVEEVKAGNLSYKIETAVPSDKLYGELDRIAESINCISEASEAAVKNELKQQRMKTDLISNVSHDLKTPLTSMVSYVDLLKKEGLNSENAPEYLRIIDEKTNRLKALTEDLFEAAKASSGSIPVEMTEIDLMALVNQSLGEMGERLEKRGLNVILSDRTENGVKVKADGKLLWRVIENLLLNASKYAQENSRVYIDITEAFDEKKDTRMISLAVKNISESQLNISEEELMERFVRGDESRNTEGSGLGLAIARDLVNLMGGTFGITIDGDLFKAEAKLVPAE